MYVPPEVNTCITRVIDRPATVPPEFVANTLLLPRASAPITFVELPYNTELAATVVGSVREVVPVVVNVREKAPLNMRDAEVGMVRVADDVLVIVSPLMEVAVATPSTGVMRVGVLARTIAPVPVTVLPCAVIVPEVG